MRRSNDHETGHRFLLYSHDSFGVGHLSRSCTIARALVESFPGSSAIIATGSPCATRFPSPPGVDVVKLPSVSKDGDGRYVPRSLPVAYRSLMGMRSRLLLELFSEYRPSILVVDHKVIGLDGELLPVLRAARSMGTRTILGLRDVIDTPSAVAREWEDPKVLRALQEDFDRICIYGWPTIYDQREEYAMPPSVAERVEFTGYVVRTNDCSSMTALPGPRPRVVVTVGGGEDGSQRLDSYLASLELGEVDWDTTLLTGPLMDPAEASKIERRAGRYSNTHVQRFRADLPSLLSSASAVVAMAGYNTTAEILRSRTPSILLPRQWPREEQFIRASRLAQGGLARCLTEPTPAELRGAVLAAVDEGRGRHELPPLDGANAMCAVVGELLGEEAIAPERVASR